MIRLGLSRRQSGKGGRRWENDFNRPRSWILPPGKKKKKGRKEGKTLILTLKNFGGERRRGAIAQRFNAAIAATLSSSARSRGRKKRSALSLLRQEGGRKELCKSLLRKGLFGLEHTETRKGREGGGLLEWKGEKKKKNGS